MMVKARLIHRRGRAVSFLDESMRWHLEEWRVGLPKAKQFLGERLGVPIDDHQSRHALRELLLTQCMPQMEDEST